VAARSKPWTFLVRSKAEIMGSNPTQGMDVCVRLFCVCVVRFVGSSHATGWYPVQGVLPKVQRLRNWKTAKVHKGCRETISVIMTTVPLSLDLELMLIIIEKGDVNVPIYLYIFSKRGDFLLILWIFHNFGQRGLLLSRLSKKQNRNHLNIIYFNTICYPSWRTVWL
jgi:hypothetical protein